MRASIAGFRDEEFQTRGGKISPCHSVVYRVSKCLLTYETRHPFIDTGGWRGRGLLRHASAAWTADSYWNRDHSGRHRGPATGRADRATSREGRRSGAQEPTPGGSNHGRVAGRPRLLLASG